MKPCDYYANAEPVEGKTYKSYAILMYIPTFLFAFNKYGEITCVSNATQEKCCYKNKKVINTCDFLDGLKIFKITDV